MPAPASSGETAAMTIPSALSQATSSTRGDELAVVEATIRAGQMTPLHVHRGEEAVGVLEGEIVVLVGGEATRLAAGDALTAPAGAPHAIRGASPQARFVVAARTPSAERYASFQRAVAVPDAGERDEEDAVVEALAAAGGITVLGPPGTLAAR
jgi:quercetin dioxygenase-like cupin family protein